MSPPPPEFGRDEVLVCMALAFSLAGASTSIIYRLLGQEFGRLFLGGREERQIHVHDNAQEYGNAADDRHQLQED